MRTSLRYLLPALLVIIVGGWWLFRAGPPKPTEMQGHNPPPVAKMPAPPAPDPVAPPPPAPRSSTPPAPRLIPPPGPAPTAVPEPEKGVASTAPNDDEPEEEPMEEGDGDSIETRLAAIGFSTQDIERIMEIVFTPPVEEPSGQDETAGTDEGIEAPGLDEMADDFRTRFTAAGFSPKDIERILEVVLAPPVEIAPEEEEDMVGAQEPSFDDMVDEFQDRLVAAGFSAQEIARILQAILPSAASGAAGQAPEDSLSPAHLRDGLQAAGFAPRDIASILQTLLQPADQR